MHGGFLTCMANRLLPGLHHVYARLCCTAQADCLPDPNSVFLFLEDHSIGRDHALFYEAYAAYLELKGNFSQAELVYQEGINRCA